MIKKQVSFSWDIHWKCNYRCPYCWWHGRWEEINGHNRYLGVQELLKTWKKIYDKYGKIKIDIVGGEPFIYPDFIQFLSEILKFCTISVTTNLAFDVNKLIESLDNKTINNLKMAATFHPKFAKLDSFIQKLNLLKSAGLSPAAVYLAWPPQVKDIPRYKDIFEKEDISFSVLTFWGKYNGKDYPVSYTNKEKEIIGLSIGKRSGEDFQVEPVKVNGRLCNAGHTYGTIHPNGEVIRCGGGSWQGKEVVVGNIFNPEFKLWESPRPCPYESCPCNEWAFLLEKNG